MLREVTFLNYDAPHAYAPPRERAAINTADVVMVTPAEARGGGPFVKVRFRDGKELTCVGTVDEFLTTASEQG
jgi:hypothetical protein